MMIKACPFCGSSALSRDAVGDIADRLICDECSSVGVYTLDSVVFWHKASTSNSKDTKQMTISRGIRNNNPGNIRRGDNWDGMAQEQTDGDFVQFDQAVMGIRALMKTLITYQSKHGLYTIQDMILRWAPPSENNTKTYIDSIASAMMISSEEHFSLLGDQGLLMQMAKAIVKHENGSDPYTGMDYFEASEMVREDAKS